MKHQIRRQSGMAHHKLGRLFVSILVASHGLFILANILLVEISLRRRSHISEFVIDVPLLIGLGLLYLSTLLRRRKQTAWFVTLIAYAFYLGLTIANAVMHRLAPHEVVNTIVLPVIVVTVLLVFRKQFVVRSDIQGFRWAAGFSSAVLLVALLFGVTGFLLLDKSDFHQEIGIPTAIHYTVDQFDLTTNRPLHPYTKRAHVFVDSLSVVSTAAVGYAIISLFQPLRLRLSDQTMNRRRMYELLDKYEAKSEDFFKVWPHDKQYYFDKSGESGLAFHVNRGVALCLGDPAGDRKRFTKLLSDFDELCFNNDWLPALVHVEKRHKRLYEQRGYTLQKLGQEAILDIGDFQASVASAKYFRQIRNRFTKQTFTSELLQPPHHDAVLARLNTISAEWLSNGAHTERGFVMGYFTSEYLQQCTVMVVRDAAGTIQAFLNEVPAYFDKHEMTFDMLRHASDSPGNINDFLLMEYLEVLAGRGYQRLNLGLCPLVGLTDTAQEKLNLIDNFLRFAYANGDRFYSFTGLHRFKGKYQPEWRDSYLAYQGGVRGFSRTVAALMRTMRVKQQLLDRSA